jgi:succinate dehydrogenase / fumarate reductase iron-sulfur subunit
MSAEQGKTILYRVRRFDPENGGHPHFQEFHVPYTDGMTVLDGLWRIKETIDPTLTWRASCRMGICGSCGMFINGRPRLACNTQVSEVGSAVVEVAPLPNFDILRDLVPDLRSMFDSHTAMSPYVIRADAEEQENPTAEYRQTEKEMEQYLQFSYCIKCGCCMSACPTLATDATYAGPMPLGQAQRYNSDNRDDGFAARKGTLSGESGPWRCHYAGECSRACPKGVDPAKAIQLLKRALVLDYLHLRRSPKLAQLVTKPAGIQRRPDIPEAPEPTVENRPAEPEAALATGDHRESS